MPSGYRLLSQAERLAQENKYDEADSCYRSALDLLPSSSAARLSYAGHLLDRADLEPCAEVLREAISLDDGNPAPFLFQTLRYLDLGELESARASYQELEHRSPNNQILPTLRLLLQLAEAELPMELELPKDLCVSPPVVQRLMVEVERRMLPLETAPLNRKPAPSEEEIDEAEPPPSPSVREQLNSLGEAFRGSFLRKKGLKTIEAVFRKRSPRGMSAQIGKACAYLRLARKLEPTGLRADFYLGEALLLWYNPEPGEYYLSRVRRAQECFYRARQVEGPNPYVHYYLGRCAQLLGEVVAAKDFYQRALDRFEKLPEAHYGMGQSHLLTGELSQARRYLYQAISSDLTMARERLKELETLHALDPSLLQRPLPEFPPDELLTNPKQEGTKPADTLSQSGEVTVEEQAEDAPSSDSENTPESS